MEKKAIISVLIGTAAFIAAFLVSAVFFTFIFASENAVSVVELYTYKKVTTAVYRDHCINTTVAGLKNGTKDHVEQQCSYVQDGVKAEWVRDRHAGYILDQKKTISSENRNIKGNDIATWEIPIRDRNLDEFPLCTANEIEKGVCRIENLEKYR